MGVASHLLSLGCMWNFDRKADEFQKNSLLFFLGGVRFGSIVLYPCHGKKAQGLKRGWSYVTAENAWHLANHRRNYRARELSINSLRNLHLPCPEGWSIAVISAWNAFIAIPKKWGVFIHESHGLKLHARHCYTTTCFSTKGPWFFYTQPVSERSGHARDFSRRSARGTPLGEKNHHSGDDFVPVSKHSMSCSLVNSRRVLKMDVSANLGGPANPVGAFLSRRPCWPPVCFWNILLVVWNGGKLKWLPSAVVSPMVCGEGCRSEFQPSYNSTACKIKGVLIGFFCFDALLPRLEGQVFFKTTWGGYFNISCLQTNPEVGWKGKGFSVWAIY